MRLTRVMDQAVSPLPRGLPDRFREFPLARNTVEEGPLGHQDQGAGYQKSRRETSTLQNGRPSLRQLGAMGCDPLDVGFTLFLLELLVFRLFALGFICERRYTEFFLFTLVPYGPCFSFFSWLSLVSMGWAYTLFLCLLSFGVWTSVAFGACCMGLK